MRFVVEKLALWQVSSANHSTDCSIIIIIIIIYRLGLVQQAEQWPQYQVD
jgi:hypothetical protein